MSSVTEQMLIHAQEFTMRLHETENLMHSIHKEIMKTLIEMQDKIDLLEFLLKDRKYE